MAVYFVYRCHYLGPTAKRLTRFKDDSVLDWFRNRWGLAGDDPDSAYDGVEELFGHSVYGLHRLFSAAAEHSLSPPRNDTRLRDYLDEHLGGHAEVLYRAHLVQVATDDDELEMAYYFFDDHFLARHRKRAAFLLHADWKLPRGEGNGRFQAAEKTTELAPPGEGKGTTWMVPLTFYDSGNLDDLDGGYEIKGVRLPELARHLLRCKPASGWPHEGGWPFEPRLLRAAVAAPDESLPPVEQELLRDICAAPHDDVPWNAYHDWLVDAGRPGAGRALLERGLRRVAHYPVSHMGGGSWSDRLLGEPRAAWDDLDSWATQGRVRSTQQPERSLVHVEDHAASACLHVSQWGNDHLYHQWLFFDDLWASAHADLAKAILRYASRWDVLS
jgi:uncharacterized protein (TIGR02996 family)